MDREARRATVHGVTKSQTRLSDGTELKCEDDNSDIDVFIQMKNQGSGIRQVTNYYYAEQKVVLGKGKIYCEAYSKQQELLIHILEFYIEFHWEKKKGKDVSTGKKLKGKKSKVPCDR